MRESFQKIVKLLNDLIKESIIKDFTLVGGLAVSSWSIPRATKDIDFLVHISEKLTVRDIRKLNERIKMEFNKTELMMDNFKKMYVIRIDNVFTLIDLIIASKSWHIEILRDSVKIDSSLLGSLINIAKPEGLIVMKLKAGGAQDIIDAKNLYELESIDKRKLFSLAKSAGVDKKLRRLIISNKSTRV